MKKFLCTALLGGLLLAGTTTYAAPLPLSDGHVLPLGPAISVHQGNDSYFFKDFQKDLTSKKLEDQLVKSLEKEPSLSSLSKKDRRLVVQEIIRLMDTTEVSQLVSDTGDHVYQAMVLSFPLTQESFQNWQHIASVVSKEKVDMTAAQNLTWEELQFLLQSGLLGSGSTENTSMALGKELGTLLLQCAHWKESRSHQGVPYLQATISSALEKNELLTPLHITLLATPGQNQIGFTLILASQTTGKYLDPYVQEAMEALQ